MTAQEKLTGINQRYLPIATKIEDSKFSKLLAINRSTRELIGELFDLVDRGVLELPLPSGTVKAPDRSVLSTWKLTGAWHLTVLGVASIDKCTNAVHFRLPGKRKLARKVRGAIKRLLHQ